MEIALDIPKNMRGLKKLKSGTSIPFFVPVIDGKHDFRVMDPEAFRKACMLNLCWICGKKMGRFCTFVGGPLVAAQEISSEPPSHPECATFAAKVCPYMNGAEIRRNHLPEHTKPSAHGVDENSGITALCTSLGYKFIENSGSYLFKFEKSEIVWLKHGKPATSDQVRDASKVAMERFRVSPAANNPQGIVRADILAVRLEMLAATLPSP